MAKRLHLALALLLSPFLTRAQETVAPTPATAGGAAGDNWDGYNITNSFETGYRFVTVSGNENKYRSDENFQDGVRLLSSFVSLNSKNGNGRLFDRLIISTNGLGGDPYEYASLTAGKNKWYDYGFRWRKNDYFNPGVTTDGAQSPHLLDTTYTLQDHDLTLLPRSSIRLLMGYTRSLQSGAGISTVQLFSPGGEFDSSGSIFPTFGNVKILQNDYRLGADAHWRGLTLNILHGWEDFKDESPLTGAAGPIFTGSGNPSVTSFLRDTSNHGTSPYWRVALFGESRRVSVNGRFTYTSGERTFLANESATGISQSGALANQQVITGGEGRRPVATGNASVTTSLTSKLTLTGTASLYNVRTQGNSAYLQFDNALQTTNLLYFQYLGIRTFASSADLLYEARSWLDLHAGYLFSDRRIASSPQVAIVGVDPGIPFEQTNQLHSGIAGFRVRPVNGLTASFDMEVGRATRPFTPKSDANYNTVSGNVRYKLRRLQLDALVHTDYNLNSASLSSFSSHARTYSGSASWLVGSWFSIDATVSKLHLDTLGGITFFEGPVLLPQQVSEYISNIYSGTLSARLTWRRADFYLGYSHVQDVGDGRPTLTSTVVGPSLPAFQAAQTFPLRFLSPMARVSLKITERIRWNAGYQYYGYGETLTAGQNYLANTGYTSLTWSF